jgi:hypothetical protein
MEVHMSKWPKKSKTGKLADNNRGPEGPRGRFWAQWIEPKGAALLSQTMGPIYFIIKNCGSNNVMLMAQQGDLMDLPPGAVRATYARGTITVENRGGKSVLIEFDFLPIYKY